MRNQPVAPQKDNKGPSMPFPVAVADVVGGESSRARLLSGVRALRSAMRVCRLFTGACTRVHGLVLSFCPGSGWSSRSGMLSSCLKSRWRGTRSRWCEGGAFAVAGEMVDA